MSYEFFRDVNCVLPFLAFAWLMFRIVKSWPAEWAKPNYQWHYRLLLVLLAGYTFLSGIAAITIESSALASIVSPLYSLQSVLILLHCATWPHPKRMRGTHVP